MHVAALLADLNPALAGATPPTLPWDLLAAVVLWGLLTGAAGRWLLARERRHGTDAPPPVTMHARPGRQHVAFPPR